MSFALLFEQLLNGLQFGVMLFLMAAGLTLVFGIMNFVNLAHGSLYMVGAYLAPRRSQLDRLVPARRGCSALAGTLRASACVVELVALRTLYERDHLDQVLATFGLILFFNELVAHHLGPRRALRVDAAVPVRPRRAVPGSRYPLYRARDHRRRPRGRASLLWYVDHAHARSAC